MTGASTVGENVAFNQVAPTSDAVDAVITQWLESDEHRENIVGDFTHTAIAVYEGIDGVYFT